MSLSVDLVDQFVQATKDEPKETNDGIAYGTVVKNGDTTYVRLDGSDRDTPVTTKTNVQNGDRVAVLIKNHTATITSNLSSHTARSEDLDAAVENTSKEITAVHTLAASKVSTEELIAKSAFLEFLLADEVVAEKIVAATAEISDLTADKANVKDLEATNASVENLSADYVKVTELVAEKATIKDLEATNAKVWDLEVAYGEIDNLYVKEAEIENLVAENVQAEIVDATTGDFKFATVDFANIGDAAITKIFASTGLIDNLTVGDGMIVTGDLAVVSLNADNIKTGTMTADRLLLKDDKNGLYYQLNLNALGEAYVTDLTKEEQLKLQNGIHGENIIANSITAKHIVADDLTAFGATIANFHIVPVPEGTDIPGKLYSDTKNTPDNTTRGVYMDTDGQFAVGDPNNFLKFYKNPETGIYELAINASKIVLGSSGTDGKDVEEAISNTIESITKQYAVTSSMDTPPSNESAGGYDITAIQNDDTQTLSIVDAVEGGDYNVVSVQNEDGTQTLSISDAWSETPPAWSSGMYLWTRDKIVYKNPSRTEYTDPVCDTSWGAANEISDDLSTTQDSADNALSTASDAKELANRLEEISNALSGNVKDNATLIETLNSAIEVIQDSLSTIVVGDKTATLLQQTSEGMSLTFADALKELLDGKVSPEDLEYRGHIDFGEKDGRPFILISAADTNDSVAAADTLIKLKLTNSTVEFVDKTGTSLATISADDDGRRGMSVDNMTVTGELRQSHHAVTTGEFVWQVRSNGNYGLSWKTSQKG